MKILFINFGGIGDEIFFLPTVMSVKKEFPDSKITLALEPRSKSIKELTNIIDDLIFVDIKSKNKYFELLKLVFSARKGQFDLVISSGSNKFVSVLLYLTGIKRRVGYHTGKLSEILLTDTVKLNKYQYACNMYHDLATPLTKHKTHLPILNIEPQEKIPNSVLIHPGVSKISIQKGITKTISADVWADLINKLLEKGKYVILAGGPDDEECIKEIRAKINLNAENFEDYYGKTKNIRDLAKLIGRAEQFVCSDSAPLHIAVALKTRIYPIFGPTDDKRLVPDVDYVIPVKVNDNCPLKPCLWERRLTTCEKLSCLQIKAEDIIKLL